MRRTASSQRYGSGLDTGLDRLDPTRPPTRYGLRPTRPTARYRLRPVRPAAGTVGRSLCRSWEIAGGESSPALARVVSCKCARWTLAWLIAWAYIADSCPRYAQRSHEARLGERSSQ